ncbi:hypothetical protein M9458_022716, partial [Cirrhinus mrigala]
DVDLRLKWPNDIYYSNLMKLGGVLVNSTFVGQTFHLLIGNVSPPRQQVSALAASHTLRLQREQQQPDRLHQRPGAAAEPGTRPRPGAALFGAAHRALRHAAGALRLGVPAARPAGAAAALLQEMGARVSRRRRSTTYIRARSSVRVFADACLCFSGTRVRLWSEDGPEAEVVGLDENGFLQVTGDQGVVSVQPDGNSFDMLRNLV